MKKYTSEGRTNQEQKVSRGCFLKTKLILPLALIIVYSLFANLGVPYERILSGKFKDNFYMKYIPLTDGTPRYIGEYDIIWLEIIGEKSDPKSTTFMFTIVNDFAVLTLITNLIYSWMSNSMVHSVDSIFDWTISVWESHPNTSQHEVKKIFNDYAITVSWVGGIMLIIIERPGFDKEINYSEALKPQQTYTEPPGLKPEQTYTEPQVLITLKSAPPEGGNISFNKIDWKKEDKKNLSGNTNNFIYAQAEPGYLFKGWYRDNLLVSEDNPYITLAKAFTTLSARFSIYGDLEIKNGTFKINEPVRLIFHGKSISQISSFDLYISYDSKYLSLDKNAKNPVVLTNTLSSYELKMCVTITTSDK